MNGEDSHVNVAYHAVDIRNLHVFGLEAEVSPWEAYEVNLLQILSWRATLEVSWTKVELLRQRVTVRDSMAMIQLALVLII